MAKTYQELLKDIEESSVPSTTVGGVGGGMIGEPPGPIRKKKKKKKGVYPGDRED